MIKDLVPDGFPWLLFALAFLAGGSIKGALGVGLPLVTGPLLTLGMNGLQAIGLLSAPVLLSNLWQSIEGGRLRAGIRRFRGLILAQIAATLITVRMTLSLSPEQFSNMLAMAVLLAVALMAWRPTLQISAEREGKLGILVGLMSGMLGGVSALTGPIIITYLMALRLSRDEFVGCISIIYFSGSLPLYLALAWYGRVGLQEFSLSLVALLPVALGLALGKMIRNRLDEALFRKVLLAFLTLLALMLLLK